MIAAPRVDTEWADCSPFLAVLELSPSALPAFSVGPLPTVAYVPDYLTAAEEASLLREIRGARRWTEVPHYAAVQCFQCRALLAREMRIYPMPQ